MAGLVVIAFIELLQCDRCMSHHGFPGLHKRVLETRVAGTGRYSCVAVCRAVDIACAWYWKQVLCLQRSAATTCLLRRYGTRARMVIAAQRIPFKAHAWVEVDGEVVNDSPSVRHAYAVVDQC